MTADGRIACPVCGKWQDINYRFQATEVASVDNSPMFDLQYGIVFQAQLNRFRCTHQQRCGVTEFVVAGTEPDPVKPRTLLWDGTAFVLGPLTRHRDGYVWDGHRYTVVSAPIGSYARVEVPSGRTGPVPTFTIPGGSEPVSAANMGPPTRRSWKFWKKRTN